MSRGIIEAQTLRSEQFELEARTSDPSDAQPGEYWIRTDQTNANPDVIAQLRRQDNSGVTTCPIFASAEDSNLGTDVVRGPSVVLDDGSVGFVAMTTGSGAVGSPRAVNAAGTEYVSHDALELSPIPDSVTSRPADDKSASETRSIGPTFTVVSDFGEIGARISVNTSGVTRARLYDYSEGSYVKTKDISGLSAGDTFSIGYDYQSGVDYAIELDDSGGSYTIGYLNSGSDYPYTGEEIDIVSRSNDGTQNSTDGDGDAQIGNLNDLGNPDNILG
jgi:hypothetical protein